METAIRLHLRINRLKNALADDRHGQDVIEYALVVLLVVLVAAISMSSVATAIGTAFSTIGSRLSTYSS
jgi:Flp pilus assembly pilin Flp